MRTLAACLLLTSASQFATAQCAPAPDSPVFFRMLAEQRAEAKLSGDRAFYEGLLSNQFGAQANGAKAVPKSDYIAIETVASTVPRDHRFYAIRNFRLVEHRQGFTVTSYTLTEGSTINGETRAADMAYRETYQVEDGKWRLTAVESFAVSGSVATH